MLSFIGRESRSLSDLLFSYYFSVILVREVKLLIPLELAAEATFWLQIQREAQGLSSKEALHRAAGSFSYEGQFRED